MSWKPELNEAGKPKYLALADALEGDIISGRLRSGERLPPQRELAADLGVTIATITRAIGEAHRRGLVSARAGSGTFIRMPQAEEILGTTLDLSLNTVPAGPAKPFLDDVLLAIAMERRAEDVLTYQPAIGSERHRRAIFRWFERRAGELRLSDVALTHGSQHGLAACFASLVRPGQAVASEMWTYTGVRRLAASAQARLVGIAMDDAGLRPDDLEAQLSQTGARVVICSTTVQNPTAVTMPLERRKDILAVCRRKEAIVVEDDIYGRLSDDPLPALAALDPERVVYLGSVSKSTSAGVRLGIMVSPTRLSADLQDKLVCLHWTAPTLYAEMFSRLIETGGADRCVAQHGNEMTRRVAMARQHLGAAIGPSLPSYHLWLPIPDQWRLDDIVSDLLLQGLKVSPSTNFQVDDGASVMPHVRVSLGAVENAEQLEPAFKIIASVWRSRPRFSGAIV